MPDRTIDSLKAQDHPLRRALVSELHIRRLPPFRSPARLLQVVVHTGERDPGAVRQHAERLCEGLRTSRPPAGRYFSVRSDTGIAFVWEHHTEFCTYTLIREGAFDDPFREPLPPGLPENWAEDLPGEVLRATQIALLAPEARPDEVALASYFDIEQMICCDVYNGEARIWSNFQVHEDGLGRLLVHDQGLRSAGDTSRLLQRLQELGNYRNMALLGFPVAQSGAPALLAMERSLATVVRAMTERNADDEVLLQRLSELSAELARFSADCHFRMSATRAYAQIVDDRLESLSESRVPGFQTLRDFTERRLVPAVRTCESFAQRLDDISRQAFQANALLRTRVETVQERQTRELLESMNRRTHLQLRLQETLEGLSVLAMSYYLIGILGYLIKAAGHWVGITDPTMLLGAVAPVALLGVWLRIRRLRRKLDEER